MGYRRTSGSTGQRNFAGLCLLAQLRAEFKAGVEDAGGGLRWNEQLQTVGICSRTKRCCDESDDLRREGKGRTHLLVAQEFRRNLFLTGKARWKFSEIHDLLQE